MASGTKGKRLEREAVDPAPEGTAVLRQAGSIHRKGGIVSDRGLRRRAEKEWVLQADDLDDVAALGRVDVWDELDAVAAAVGLSRDQKAVVGLMFVEECSLREAAARLGCTVYRVRMLLRVALERCAGFAAEPPVSPRALFSQEVREKQEILRSRRVWRGDDAN